MRRKINIVHFSSLPGGLEVLMPEVINSIRDFDFSVFLIRPPDENKPNVYQNANVKVVYGSAGNFAASFKLFAYSFHHRGEIFHVFNLGPYYLFLLRLAGVKNLIYSVRGTTYWKTNLQKFCRKISWRLALSARYRILFNSEFSKSVFLRSVNTIKPEIEVLYNPVASSKFETRLKSEKDYPKFQVIYAGRLADGKNLFRWLDMALLIQKSYPYANFLLYGDGPLRKRLESYAQELGIPDKVEFRGYTSNMAKAYHEADLLIFISEYESFGNVVVESILCGTPVIVSDIPSLREIFVNYPQVLVPLDENLGQNILEKVQHLDKLNEIIPDLISEFKIRFSAANHIERLKGIYNNF
jgi:glycosyltransferase involved in cell wall biosynthesis